MKLYQNLNVTGSLTLSGSLNTIGTITATTLVVQTITSSVTAMTGSNIFGSLASNTQVFTGSMYVTGAFYVTTGSVGIGTTIPNSYLSTQLVVSAPSFGGITIASTNNTNTNYLCFARGTTSILPYMGSVSYNHTSDFMAFATSGSERMRIDLTGSVGIGTTSPLGIVEIAGAQAGVSGKNLRISYNGTYYAEYTEKSITAFNNELIFGTGTGGTEKMRILSGGNVGIGTSSPSQKLEVSGTDNNNLIMSTTTTGAGGTIRIQANEAASYLVSNNARPLYIQTNSATRMTITSGGDVGIGTASPGCRLEIAGGYMALNDYALRWRFASDANHATVFTTTYNGPIMYGYSGAALGYQAIGVIWTSTTGAYNYNNSTTWQQTSDIRIKQNLRPITGALSKICSLNPTHFEYKNKPGKTKTGFIAQEFEQIFEGHVTETDPLPEHQEYFEEGEKIKSIDADLIPYLVKALQELKTEFDEYKTTHP
jgi:hypothetical protein